MPEPGQVFRMYTQHNVFFVASAWSIVVLVSFAIRSILFHYGGVSPSADLLPFAVVLALGPGIGAVVLAKQGPLVIDAQTQNLTYRRRVLPFARLGLVRVGPAGTLAPSTVEGVHAAKERLEIVVSGDFALDPNDSLPRRRLETLANRLNDALTEYYCRIGEPRDPTCS